MTVKEAVVARFEEILRERKMRANELAVRAGVTPSTAMPRTVTEAGCFPEASSSSVFPSPMRYSTSA